MIRTRISPTQVQCQPCHTKSLTTAVDTDDTNVMYHRDKKLLWVTGSLAFLRDLDVLSVNTLRADIGLKQVRQT